MAFTADNDNTTVKNVENINAYLVLTEHDIDFVPALRKPSRALTWASSDGLR